MFLSPGRPRGVPTFHHRPRPRQLLRSDVTEPGRNDVELNAVHRQCGGRPCDHAKVSRPSCAENRPTDAVHRQDGGHSSRATVAGTSRATVAGTNSAEQSRRLWRCHKFSSWISLLTCPLWCSARCPWFERYGKLSKLCSCSSSTDCRHPSVESAPPRFMTARGVATFAVVVKYIKPAPVGVFVAPTSSVTKAAPAPMVEHVARGGLQPQELQDRSQGPRCHRPGHCLRSVARCNIFRNPEAISRFFEPSTGTDASQDNIDWEPC